MAQALEPKIKQLALEPLLSKNATQLAEQANEFIKEVTKEIRCLKQAQKWLKNKNYRLELAIEIAESALENEVLGFYSTPKEEEDEDKTEFIYNLYECLNCLFQSFETAVHKEISNDIRRRLSQHDLELYIKGFRIFEEKAIEYFSEKEDVIILISEYTKKIIEDISSY